MRRSPEIMRNPSVLMTSPKCADRKRSRRDARSTRRWRAAMSMNGNRVRMVMFLRRNGKMKVSGDVLGLRASRIHARNLWSSARGIPKDSDSNSEVKVSWVRRAATNTRLQNETQLPVQ